MTKISERYEQAVKDCLEDANVDRAQIWATLAVAAAIKYGIKIQWKSTIGGHTITEEPFGLPFTNPDAFNPAALRGTLLAIRTKMIHGDGTPCKAYDTTAIVAFIDEVPA